MKLCECGCGEPAPIAAETQRSRGAVKGQPQRFVRGHSGRAKIGRRYRESKVGGRNGDRSYEHIRVAEKALGKPLPKGANVHHVDGNKRNNDPGNLVICQDMKYHKLLHIRTEAFWATGNANLRRCRYCQNWDDPAAMKFERGWSPFHPECRRKRQREYYACHHRGPCYLRTSDVDDAA
jgi:hypothetical protein